LGAKATASGRISIETPINPFEFPFCPIDPMQPRFALVGGTASLANFGTSDALGAPNAAAAGATEEAINHHPSSSKRALSGLLLL
jgi:hypothetical protein